jgi:hypothetical protein
MYTKFVAAIAPPLFKVRNTVTPQQALYHYAQASFFIREDSLRPSRFAFKGQPLGLKERQESQRSRLVAAIPRKDVRF